MGDVPGTETEICNGAIALLGGGKGEESWLTNYETDTTVTADWCRKLYDTARRKGLKKHDWEEAKLYLAGTDAGADVAAVEHTGYSYAYQIPTEPKALALRGIVDDDLKFLEYKRSGNYIHTDYETDEFTWYFIKDLESGFSTGLTTCIEYELAILLAAPLFGGQTGMELRQGLIKEYSQIALPEAIAENQKEQYTQPKDDEWVDVE